MLLTINPNFISDIENIRKIFPVPTHLTPTSDAHIGRLFLLNYQDNDDLFSGEFTHKLLNEENRERLRKKITKIIKKYELGMNFFTWIQWFILYGEPTTDIIDPDFNFYKRLKNNPIELFRLPKTTAEKKEIKKWFREIHKFPTTGRIPKEHTDYYNYFVSILDRKKPNKRRPKVDHTIDFAVLNQHKKIVSIDGENIKNTYEVLVSVLTDEASVEEDYKKMNTLRKRKERIIKQVNKIKS